jgi:hypothetical protein
VSFSANTSEAAAVPEVVRQTRERTAGQRGIIWLSDGHHAYEKAVRRTYRAKLRTGAPGRPRYVMTPGVGLTQVVKTRKRGRIVNVEVRHRFGPEPTSPHTVRGGTAQRRAPGPARLSDEENARICEARPDLGRTRRVEPVRAQLAAGARRTP